MKTLLVLGFGVVGVACRFALNELGMRYARSSFPIVTLSINVLGSFAIGCVAVAALEKGAISENVRVALMVGLLGGFTTFSAFSLETLALWESEQRLLALGYAVGSPVLGILAAFLGMAFTRSVLG